MLRRPGRGILFAAIAVALAACDPTAELAIFTDFAFTPDGRALVLESTEGIFVASPPTASPQRISARHCTRSPTRSLDCVRMSADGSRLAILSRQHGDPAAPVWDLHQYRLADAKQLIPFLRVEPALVSTEVFDAAFSQDGTELIYAGPGPEPKTVAIRRLGPGNVEEELVRSITLGTAPSSEAGAAFALTPYGVAWPRITVQGVEVWFKPWDRPMFQSGLLRAECAGANFNRCVVGTPEGNALAWQDKTSYVLNVLRPQQDQVLPLGRGYGFSFSRSGAFALRMDAFPDAAYVQDVDTASVVRRVVPAAAAELAADGESIAYLQIESETTGAARLFVGPSRRTELDHDYDVFEPSVVKPLVAQSVGQSDVGFSFSGDARFVVVNAAGSTAKSARLISVTVGTSERVELDELRCESCCVTSPEGSMLMCLPTLTPKSNEALPVDIYDLASGRKTRVTEKAGTLEMIPDGSGAGVLEMKGQGAELVVAAKDGTRKNLGPAVRFAFSPTAPTVAILSPLGGLTVRPLP